MGKFDEGEQVLAKSPTSQEFVKAKIVGVRGNNKYRVQFRGGVEHTISESDVKVLSYHLFMHSYQSVYSFLFLSVSLLSAWVLNQGSLILIMQAQRTSRSQTRSRGRPAGKSPARNSQSRRSPARKSPARSPNSQGRKLPVRRQAKVTIARLEMQKGWLTKHK